LAHITPYTPTFCHPNNIWKSVRIFSTLLLLPDT
jgi:hypothetical protein